MGDSTGTPAIELRCERTLWRALSPFGTPGWSQRLLARQQHRLKAGKPKHSRTGTILLGAVLLLYIPSPLVVHLGNQRAWWDVPLGTALPSLIVAPFVLVALGGTLLAVNTVGTLWWLNGRGTPVLSVSDGVLRGRIRASLRGASEEPPWDFELPVAEVTSAALRQGHLVLGLPDQVSEQLLSGEATAIPAEAMEEFVGSPAAWPASMLPKAKRDERMERLVADLEELRTTSQGI